MILTFSACTDEAVVEAQLKFVYRKVPKFSDVRKIQTNRPYLKVFCQKHADGIANSEDPDQTAPLGAV